MTDGSYRVTLRFSDGVDVAFVAPPGVAVLDAALAAAAPVLYQCRSGSCGTCSAHLVSGDAPMDSQRGSALLPSEKAAGQRLLCSAIADSDCVFDLDYDSQAGAHAPTHAQAFIDTIDWVGVDVVRLKLELAEGDWLDFQPGQFVRVSIPGSTETRSYSMASPPSALPQLELLVRILPQGLMSDYLRNTAKVNDVLTLEGPYGSFFLRGKARKPHIFVAGGTGLAPILSMIDVIRTQSGVKPPLLLSFGCVTNDNLFHLDELELRRQWLPSLSTRVSIDRGTVEDLMRIGNPVNALTSDDIIDVETIAYLCGPPGMVAAARAHLEALGVAPSNIHAEQFAPSADTSN